MGCGCGVRLNGFGFFFLRGVTMIYQTIDTASQMLDEFRKFGRENNFSYEGMGLLYDFLDSLGEDIELDVVALCCDYAEDTAEDIAHNYGLETEGMDEGEILDAVLDYLEKNTIVIGKTDSGSIVYGVF